MRNEAVAGLLVFTLTSGVAWPATSQPAADPTPVVHRLWGELIVRNELSREDLQELTTQVSRIWSPYGVEVVWERRTPPSAHPAGFSGWIRVLIDAHATDYVVPRRDRNPAVAAVHMAGGAPRNVIYVSVATADALVRRAARDLPSSHHDRLVARLAGRAVAHELGHYLLGSAAHAEEGLMRGLFTVADVLDPHLARFQLAPAAVDQLTDRLLVERAALAALRSANGR